MLKVIGAGLPRTATTTQKLALEILDLGPCYHMRDMMSDMRASTALWRRAFEGESPWDEIFDGYRSMTDWPGAYHWRELMDVYPDSKVLLSVRDADSWERSMSDTINQIYWGDSFMRHLAVARREVDPDWKAWMDLMIDMTWADTGPFAGTNGESEPLKQAMERYNDEVKSTVPDDRLLVWHPKDGWEPLCEFLDAAVPDQEVPQVNDTQAFKDGIIGSSIDALHAWWDKQRPPGP